MNLKKIFTCITAFLTLSLCAVSVFGIEFIGSASIYKKPGISSAVTVGANLDEKGAAERLFYLGMFTGSGTNKNGEVEFELSRGLTRIESTVLAVRLLGAEDEAESGEYYHPFTDVPDWASGYVGYIYSLGLISDIAGEEFYPSSAETQERFMSYMLYALGYRIELCDYTYNMAAEYARDAGIFTARHGEPLTRGKAVEAMYNTLRSTVKDSKIIYSDILVENGSISYQDAVFLIWTCDREETARYISMVGYSAEWVIPDGYYKIKSSKNGMLLNVAVDGPNHDYEGVPVTIWNDTDDISQTFRIERTARGTYYIYSAASRGGYGRVIGDNNYNGGIGLYSFTGQAADEFKIIGSADGSWVIESVSEPGVYLSFGEDYCGAPVSLSSESKQWMFEREGIMNSGGEEMAIFVSNSIYITQGAYDDYSHQTQNALDMIPMEGMVFAPFNATVVRIDSNEYSCNAVWIQSTSKVRYADGTYDYMTALFMHDNDVSDLYIGQKLTQGEYFYNMGNYGVSSGLHVHLALYRGEYNHYMRLGSGDINAEDALYVPDNTYIYEGYGLDWKVVSLAE